MTGMGTCNISQVCYANQLTDSTEMTSEEIEEQAEFQLYPKNGNPCMESEEEE